MKSMLILILAISFSFSAEITSEAQFNQLFGSSKLVLFDLYADWCGPCRALSPTLEQVQKERMGKVELWKINTDKFTKIAAKFNVTAIPRVMFTRNGTVLSNMVGMQDKSAYLAQIDQLSGSAQASVVNATPALFAAKIKSAPGLVLDVRTKEEFAGEHLANARLIPVGELANRLAEIASFKDKPVYIYCRSGHRSQTGVEILQKGGFKKIIQLTSGINGWKVAKLPVTR